jgi:O-antigen/teichoic acid export membrane protein
MLRNDSISVKRIRALLKTSVFANFINLSSIQVSNAVIMMLLYLILARKVGLEAFGEVIVANALAQLIGIVINFGTNQSGIKEVATHKENPLELSRIFYSTLILRSLLFITFLLAFIIYFYTAKDFSLYFLFAIPLILSEVLNPLFIYLGKESLALYNISNLLAKVFIIFLVMLTIENHEEAVWVNFILGSVHLVIYLLLLIRISAISGLRLTRAAFKGFSGMLRSNFYLVGNNLSVQLQQSLMLLVIAKWGNPAWVGPYSLCDKITWSGRLMIISVCNSVYPKAAAIFQADPELFKLFKRKIRKLLLAVFTTFSAILIVFASPIIHLMAGSPDENAAFLLRIMAFLQVIAAINSFNVIELLIRGNNVYIFRIAMILLIVAGALSFGIALSKSLFLLGTYALAVELSALLMYEYVLHRDKMATISTAQ